MRTILSRESSLHHTLEEVASHFATQEDIRVRGEYLQKSFDTAYNELDFEGVRIGFKASADALAVWDGSFLSRTSESSLRWHAVAALVESLVLPNYRVQQAAKMVPTTEPPLIEQLALFPVEADQISYIDEGKTVEQSAVFSFAQNRDTKEVPQDVVDAILTAGAERRVDMPYLVGLFLQEQDVSRIAVLVQQHYGTQGMGFSIDNQSYAMWCDKKGMCIAQGSRAMASHDAAAFSWEEIATRMQSLLQAGTLASAADIAHAAAIYRDDVAESIALRYRDLHAIYHNEQLDSVPYHGSVPDYKKEFSAQLATPEGLQNILAGLEQMQYDHAHTQGGIYLGTYTRSMQQVVDMAKSLQNPLLAIPAPDVNFRKQSPSFITEDELDALFLYAPIAGGKQRIFNEFAHIPDKKGRIDFLKNQYGLSGRSFTGTSVMYDATGVRYERGANATYATKKLNWNQAVDRISRMMLQNRYLTDAEKKAEQEKPVQEKQTVPAVRTIMHSEFASEFVKTSADFVDQEMNLHTNADGKEFVLGYGKLGNGTTVWNYFDTENGDYKQVAHIGEDGVVAGYDKRLPTAAIEEIERNAEKFYLQAEPVAAAKTPAIQFFVDFKDVERSLDYTQYRDRDIIGYNVDGVKYTVGKSGSMVYTTQTTAITPAGEILGGEMSPEVHAKYLAWKQSLSATQVAEQPKAEAPKIPAQNYRITNPNLGTGTNREKVARNIAAIQTLQRIEDEQRHATPAEQEALAQYVGWGGLPEVFDENKTAWTNEFTQLRDLLSDSEYASARASTLNAHYTAPVIIQSMYDKLAQMGFATGNVLEPACGTGNFLGMLPESMQNSQVYGVELDAISGRIAQALYPDAKVQISGFESTQYPDDFFDVAVGNVPFGNYKLSEKRYDKQGLLIHDHFFMKSLDKVRAGGVVAFITSKGTLDKESEAVRRALAQKADLLGAVRLPNNAFKANAGTEVTSDIIFLQKRESPPLTEPTWVQLGTLDNGIAVNSYFAEHPEMILGEMQMQSGQFGMESTCIPLDDADLSTQLAQAMAQIHGEIPVQEFADLEVQTVQTVPADPAVRNYSYALVNGEIMYREGSIMTAPNVSESTKERIIGMVQLRDVTRDLLDLQLENGSDEQIAAQQQFLNDAYDTFAKKFGLINDKNNRKAFAQDNSYYLLSSLEVLNENGKLERKADIFSKRTIQQAVAVTTVDTPAEALAVSIAERAGVDIPFMAQLCNKLEADIANELQGVIFKDPLHCDEDVLHARYFTADAYLSGNVREKLALAKTVAESHPEFTINVAALEAAMPKELDASEIDVRLGATWIDVKYVQQFMREVLHCSRFGPEVHFTDFTAEWSISNKNSMGHNDVTSTSTFGTSRANAYSLLADALNLRDARVFDVKTDADGTERRVLNQKETTLAQQKQQAIKTAFTDWIFKKPERRKDLVETYNVLFNSVRPREYDGQHINFIGMNPEIKLREHQINAIAHILYGGNTLLAHEVGAGKTYEMIASAMESKRLGLCQKPLFVVPNHLTEQWANEFLTLYPAANILVTTKKDFEKENRKRFCARIATGDYDAIIMGHSQFERLPMSQERQQAMLDAQVEEVTEGIRETKRQRGDNVTIKQLERTKKGLEAKLKKLMDSPHDDVVTFEQLGVDRLIMDEAHAYKNLFLYTKMRNVAGLSTSEAQKSSDMFLKCRYMDEKTDNKGVVFATGTPVSNTMAEVYTMMRYLQYDTLRKQKMTHFDAWASNFGETQTSIELAPEGTGYRARTRFSKFFNLPELMTMFKEVADIKTADQLHLPTPECTIETVVAKPSEIQTALVQELGERAEKVHANRVDPSEDNMRERYVIATNHEENVTKAVADVQSKTK